MEEHCLSGEAGSKAHSAAAFPGLSAAHEFIKNEHDGGRTHVAVALEDMARGRQGVRWQGESTLDGVEDGAAAGVNAPEGDVVGCEGTDDVLTNAVEAFADGDGNLTGEEHVEAEATNLPGDEVAGFGQENGAEAVEREAGWFGGEDAGGAAVGEEEKAEHLLEVVRFLQMKCAELEINHEHACGGFGADDVACCFQAVDGGVTAHEADHGALDGGTEA